MESLSKLKNKIDVDKILEKGNLAKNMVRNLVMNYSETEAKVIDATNNEAWGPSSTVIFFFFFDFLFFFFFFFFFQNKSYT